MPTKDKGRLEGLPADFLARYKAAQAEAARLGIDLFVGDPLGGMRSVNEQEYLRRKHGDKAAKPSPNAPHVRGHALDVSAVGAGVKGIEDPRVQRLLKRHGLIVNRVEGEPWHVEYHPESAAIFDRATGRKPTDPNIQAREQAEAVLKKVLGQSDLQARSQAEGVARQINAQDDATARAQAEAVLNRVLGGGRVVGRGGPPPGGPGPAAIRAREEALYAPAFEPKAIPPLHLYPEEYPTPPDDRTVLGRVGQFFSNVLTPQFAQAEQQRSLARGFLAQTHGVGPLPDPPAKMDRRQAVRERQRLQGLLDEIRRSSLPGIGGPVTPYEKQKKELIKSLTPWQRQLLPHLEKALAVEEILGNETARAALIDVASQYAGAKAGAVVTRAVFGKLIASSMNQSIEQILIKQGLGPAWRRLLGQGVVAAGAGAVGGGTGAAATAGTATLLTTGDPKLSLKAAGQAVPLGIGLGGAFGVGAL
ncbi:MAG TPA: hypothetical protein VFR31_03170, partial [Thermoanaerobaculia bacterium]|nr:hypothetical protein [Thermoanaerobaculia bacterium]